MQKQKKTILIVEDEAPILKALIRKFTIANGFNVIGVKNGEEGLSVALSEHPDLIVLDIVMPKMSGLDMLEQLRKDSWGKDVKVMILTNLGDDEKVARAVTEGAYQYFVKADWKIEDVVEKAIEQLNS